MRIALRVGCMKSFSLCSHPAQEISTTLASAQQEAWLCVCMWHLMSLALMLSLWPWVICHSRHPHLGDASGRSELFPCQGKLQTGGKIQTFAIPELLHTSRYFTCQLSQPNIKLHGKTFGYLLSFSVANSFCKRPWDCSWGRVWLQRQAGDSHWSQKKQEKAPRKAGVGH